MTTLAQVLNQCMNGCVHEFHVADLMQCDRFSILVCRQCQVEAMAGEVAWMLAGGQIVKIALEVEAAANENLMALANMPTVGGKQ